MPASKVRQARHPRRRHDGRGHRLRLGQGRHRRGAARHHAGGGRAGQGLFAGPARQGGEEGPQHARRSATRCWRASRRRPTTRDLAGLRPRRSRPCSRTARSRPT
ncbi:MAG: hypothetical protein MZW92_74120 [Comamonadaceae bacterium]|nr:hypothetical protein [Comamonadaceae bacterium]